MIAAFRRLLAASAPYEERDPAPILAWLEGRRRAAEPEAEIIALAACRGWRREPDTGDVVHERGAFFSVRGIRFSARGLREVDAWDQPILCQPTGGLLAIVCQADTAARPRPPVVRFLLQAKAEPGTLRGLQLAPTIEASWSNIERAHHGRRPPLAELALAEVPGCRLVYEASHNEEGSRFYRKSNANRLVLLEPPAAPLAADPDRFVWVTLAQAKALMLCDDVVGPYVKTVLAPL